MTLTTLKRRLPILILATMTGYTSAQQPAPPAVTSQLTQVQATIQSIYPAKRAVTLVGPQGAVTIFVGPEVKNFDQLHVGDKVNMSIYQGVAAQIAKGDMKVSDPAAATFAYHNPAGSKPGGGIGASVTVTVTIKAVDTAANTVSFQESDGSTHIIAVKSPNMREFIRTLKPGDSVNVTYTDSVAISVVPAS